MLTSKNVNKICVIITILAIILTALFMNAEYFGIQKTSSVKEYETTLFDTSIVHTIDIQMDDWESFLYTCKDEEYTVCSLTIDGETYSNVAIRGKGNTSLTQVESYGNDRYSFKIEFNHYDDSINYYGLDRLCLNNIIQDNTYMKDYLTYQMMNFFDVDAPLSSFTYITVNGEDWGLYVAVEDITNSFLERNYGNDYGNLYKPDSTGNMGGGQDKNMERPDFENMPENAPQEMMNNSEDFTPQNVQDNNLAPQEMNNADFTPPQMPTDNGENMPNGGRDKGGTMSSDDTLLIYTDDNYESYSNIFDNAKTDITNADKDRLIESLKQLNEGENIEQVVNIDEVIRYFVVHNFVCNFDSYTGSMIHNYYLYEQDGQMSMIPWDYNLAFGGFQNHTDATSLVNYPIDTPVSGLSVENRPMLSWIFENEQYTELYHAYFSEFISTYFDSGYFTQMMEQTFSLIAPYVQKDPTKFCTYDEFETGFEVLKQFCMLRAESITGQLNGTIPSTSDEQTQDTLIDASFITISDMGSMNANSPNRMQINQTDQNATNENKTQNQSIQPPNDKQMSRDNQNNSHFTQSNMKNEFILILISFSILVIGIIIATLYKKRV